jgi:hypothetical protein
VSRDREREGKRRDGEHGDGCHLDSVMWLELGVGPDNGEGFFFTFSDSFLIIRQGVQRSKQDPNYKGYMKQKNNWVLDSSIQ